MAISLSTRVHAIVGESAVLALHVLQMAVQLSTFQQQWVALGSSHQQSIDPPGQRSPRLLPHVGTRCAHVLPATGDDVSIDSVPVH